MKPDIQKRLKDDFGNHFYEALKEINEWDAERKGLLPDRFVRAVIHLAEGDIEEFKRMKEASKRDYRDVLLWAEYDEFKIQVRDFNKPFGQEEVSDALEPLDRKVEQGGADNA